jgi:MSHA pilin protein MshA
MHTSKIKDYEEHGFTLIELIIVIVVLGILSATAVPKLINLRKDANIATLTAMGGAILSNANMVYAKSVIQGFESETITNIDLDSDGIDDVEVVYGYPSGHRNNGIPKMMGGDFATAWTWSANASNTLFWLTTATLGKRSGVYINNTAVSASNCYLLYYQATSSAAPRVSYVTTNC